MIWLQKDNTTGAHIAAAPITITAEREAVVDFVAAFQNLGLSILVKKPWGDAEQPPSIFSISFSIFAPITGELWMFVIVAFIVVCIYLSDWVVV